MSYLITIIKYMFDTQPGDTAPATTTLDPDPRPDDVPLERLESQICELAGHLAAATCRFPILLGDFDARKGWADWEMTSCAQWLSWKCQLSSGTAREHVRVARALRDLPVIRAEFAAAHLSYAKVRALTRIATPVTEAGLAEIAGPMTANQLERFARAHRQVSHADDDTARLGRRLSWRFEEDGTLSGTFRLPPAAGAVFLQSLRAAATTTTTTTKTPAATETRSAFPRLLRRTHVRERSPRKRRPPVIPAPGAPPGPPQPVRGPVR
jgi:hypothetical protein